MDTDMEISQTHPASEEYKMMKVALIRCLVLDPRVVLQSQQRGEPDLSERQKEDIAMKLLDEKPSVFLDRLVWENKSAHVT